MVNLTVMASSYNAAVQPTHYIQVSLYESAVLPVKVPLYHEIVLWPTVTLFKSDVLGAYLLYISK